MSLTHLDLAIIGLPFVIIMLVAWRMRRYMRSVADYLAASRCARRYLITSASGETLTGVMAMVTALEIFSRTGFSLSFWNGLAGVIMFFVGILGLVSYRMRETRALTFHQFLELRYSRGVRVLASFLNVFSGLFSFGVGPAVGARFFVYFCGMDKQLNILGQALPTYALIMLGTMAVSLTLTLSGGQISTMVADSLEALFSKYLYLVVVLFIIATVSVSQMREALLSGDSQKSYINPFDTSGQSDFDGWFVFFTIVLSLYQYRGSGSTFTSAAKNAHESRMAGILVNWRSYNYQAMLVLISLGAFTVLHHADFAGHRLAIENGLKNVANDTLRTQMQMPMALGVLLVPGVKGCLCAVALFGLMANQGNYIHMYGSTILQDVIMPLRKTPFSPRQHMLWLRASAAFVACFACAFSLLFKPMDYLKMITMLMGTIYLGGVSCVVWGGLYWKRGTARGAFASLSLAAVLAVGFNIVMQYWPSICPALSRWSGNGIVAGYLSTHARKFPINGMELSAIISLMACLTYIVVSLLTCRKPFNLDAMLHRGLYRVEGGEDRPEPVKRSLLGRLVNINEHFSRGDKVLAYATVAWTLAWKFLAVGIFLWIVFVGQLSDRWWFEYTMISHVWVTVALGFVVTIWFTYGIVRDMRALFRTLKTAQRNDADDGTVRDHENAGDEHPLVASSQRS